MDIKVIKLNSGEELIAEVIDGDAEDENIILRNVLRVLVIGDENGISYFYEPFSLVSGDELAVLKESSVLTFLIPSDSAVEHYQKTVQERQNFFKDQEASKEGPSPEMPEEESVDSNVINIFKKPSVH